MISSSICDSIIQINNKKTNLDRAIPTLILTALLVVIIVLAAPIIVFAQQAQTATQIAIQNATKITQDSVVLH